MTFKQATEIIRKRYGLLSSYVDVRTGNLMTVVKAESELRTMRKVAWPGCGLSLFASEIIDLARGDVTVSDLVARKNPEAAELGRRGGSEISKRGSEYFRQLQAKRKVRAGGRPPKEKAP